MSDLDDLELEEWLSLSDEQQEAAIDREFAKLVAIEDQMPRPALYAARRASILKTCLGWRRHHKTFRGAPFTVEYLRKSQMCLVRLRSWRATGYQRWPGRA